jgi:hypothetical protein
MSDEEMEPSLDDAPLAFAEASADFCGRFGRNRLRGKITSSSEISL